MQVCVLTAVLGFRGSWLGSDNVKSIVVVPIEVMVVILCYLNDCGIFVTFFLIMFGCESVAASGTTTAPCGEL
jgi:hypothetical protein